MRFLNKNEVYSSLILRLGLAFVFIMFGIDKFIVPQNWTGYVAPFIENMLPFSLITFMYILGVIEIILGTLLLLGLFTQWTAVIITLMMLSINLTIGFNDVTIRDIGLMAASLALALRPSSPFSLDKLRKRF